MEFPAAFHIRIKRPVKNRTSPRRPFVVRCVMMSVLLVIATVTTGCSPAPAGPKDRATVSGVVKFDGQPLPGGVLNFQSTERPVGAMIMIKAGGVYSTDRAPLGENVVTVETASLQFGNGAAFVRIPVKYSDPKMSGLVIDVKPGANENIDFLLAK
jgi:hypothetical protein